MKGIDTINVLHNELKQNEIVWLLLYKKGSTQSDCAFSNFEAASKKINHGVLLHADVNTTRDIHPVYNCNSVPTLLQFKKGELINLVKGCQKPEHFQSIFKNASPVPVVQGDKKAVNRVTVYTTPTCSWCTTIKKHLNQNGVKYSEIDVSKNQKAAQEMARKSGQQGVPQTDINGQVVIGFDRNKINNLLGIN
jgi:glutaredoxin-like YruB-family protein